MSRPRTEDDRCHAAVLVCKCCGSTIIDVNNWLDGKTAVVRCYHCCATAELKAFTIGRARVSRETLATVRKDAARLSPNQREKFAALPDDLGLPELFAGERKIFGLDKADEDDRALSISAAIADSDTEPLRQVLSALESRGQRTLSTFGHLAWCPVRKHDRPHLFIGVARDGAVALECRDGCSFDEICEALEMEPADLFKRGKAGNITAPGGAAWVTRKPDHERAP